MEKIEINKEKQLTEIEKDALRRVYHSFLSYMETFKDTEGFSFGEEDYGNAYILFEALKYDLNYEYIDLKRTVFDKLYAFIDKELSTTIEWYDSLEPMEFEQEMAAIREMYKHMMDSFKAIVDEYLV